LGFMLDLRCVLIACWVPALGSRGSTLGKHGRKTRSAREKDCFADVGPRTCICTTRARSLFLGWLISLERSRSRSRLPRQPARSQSPAHSQPPARSQPPAQPPCRPALGAAYSRPVYARLLAITVFFTVQAPGPVHNAGQPFPVFSLPKHSH
jgi:hypothetical protein